MGIKFRCPNGHKLNVKSFLAGKRGVCPDCGATFRIPEEPGGSDIQALPLASVKGSNGAVPQPQDVPETVAFVPAASVVPVGQAALPAIAVVAPAAMASPVTAVGPTPTKAVMVQPVAVGGVAIPAATGIPLPKNPAMMPATVAAPGVMPATYPGAAPIGGMPRPPALPVAGDPIAEAPAAIWYVRPPSGGQYGPARGDIMRKWIAEGRVSGDSLVWREGWTDWRNAAQLFPSLATAGGPAATAVVPAAVAPQSARSTSRYAARKKGGSGLAIAALVGLVVVCIVLVVVLVVVLAQQAA